jgi:hypothetical protein
MARPARLGSARIETSYDPPGPEAIELTLEGWRALQDSNLRPPGS